MTDNLFLIGLMGAGKSTIGKQLARELGKDFLDSDSEIESRTGVTIDVIFDIEGEQGFRRRETGMLRELVEKRGIVLATGGGAVLTAENQQLLKDNGWIIYLQAAAEHLAGRVRLDRRRPLLQSGDKLEKIRRSVTCWPRENRFTGNWQTRWLRPITGVLSERGQRDKLQQHHYA